MEHLTEHGADRAARTVSLALIPPAVSATVFTVLAVQDGGMRTARGIASWLTAVACSGLLQILYVLCLRARQKVTAYDVPQRLQRTGPYAVSAALSFTGLGLLILLGAPQSLRALMWCFAWNTLLLLAINRFWKISAHMMGLTGPLTFLFPFCGWTLLAAAPVALALGWARVRTRSHSPAQVLAGAAAGITLTWAQMALLRVLPLPSIRFIP